jgi:hypothetical protein
METLKKEDLEEIIIILDDEFKKYCNDPKYEKELTRIHDRYTLYQIEYFTRYGIFLK